ncbi:MAG: electron transport complex subunit RsxC [Kangiellaceae bacterium]
MKAHTKNLVTKSIFNFHGGIYPEEHKLISSESQSQLLLEPSEYKVPINQSSQASLDLSIIITVETGQRIKKGETLTKYSSESDLINVPIHSPCDGVIEKIELSNCGHKSELLEPVIIIKSKAHSKQRTSEVNNKQKTSHSNWKNKSTTQLLRQIRDAGIVGLGGAVFPTHFKQSSKLDSTNEENPATLIVNAMECEPYITCDDRLLREHSKEIIEGALISSAIINCEKIIFAIEDNKPEATKALTQAINLFEKSQAQLSIVIAPTKYPSGGEKQLIQLVTGKELAKNQFPKDLNIIVQNVATLFAIYQSIVVELPMTNRLVTITGNLVANPGNYWISFGTPINHIINSLDIDRINLNSVIIGGPLMGQKITDFSIPTSKKVNCLIFNEKVILAEAKECIRCGECESVCPIKLIPQQLYWFSKTEQWKSIEELSINACIECGACDYVCPSNIPLVNYFQFAKSELKYLSTKEQASELAKIRFDNREKRLLRIKEERRLKREKVAQDRKQAAENKANDPDGKKAAILAALNRVKKNQEKAK